MAARSPKVYYKTRQRFWLFIVGGAIGCLLTLLTVVLHSTQQSLPYPSPVSQMKHIRRRAQFLLLGDSLTERSFNSSGGWGASLAHEYRRKVDVLNRGYGGYNSRWALYLVNDVVKTHHPDPPLLATVFFGANDASFPDGTSGRHHVQLEEYESNLKEIIKCMKANKITHIISLTPPPISEQGRLRDQKQKGRAFDTPDRSNYVTGTYAEACREASRQMGVPNIDLWALMQEEEPLWADKFLDPDGLHLSEGGQQFIFKKLMATIAKEFPNLMPDALPNHWPWWGDIDMEHAAEQFKAIPETL